MEGKRLCTFHWGWSKAEGGRYRKGTRFWICGTCTASIGKPVVKNKRKKPVQKYDAKIINYMSSIK